MASFLESNKDFVIKLTIQTADHTQIRRLSLPRIADASGNISYEELAGLVLVFSLPEETDSSRINNYTASLTYYDDEKDLITLASTEELKDAIDLFAEQKCIRITTSVKTKTTYSAPPPFAATKIQDTDRGTPPKDDKYHHHTRGPPIHAVLESFAGILATAVNNLQEGFAKQSSTSPSEENSQWKPPPVAPTHKPKDRFPKANGKIKKGTRAGNKVDKISDHPLPKKVSASCTTKSSSTGPTLKTSPTNNDKKISFGSSVNKKKAGRKFTPGSPDKGKYTVGNAEKAKDPDDPKPFIHGRHTCDGCLTTPIIGKRYHATNLPDYDVCSKCFGNVKGSEIKFEPVELRRDIAFQSRWRLRQETNEKLMRMCRRPARSSCYSSRVSPSSDPTANCQNQSQLDDKKQSCINPSSFSNHSTRGQKNQNKTDTDPVRQDNAFNSNDFDSLKEAIRRSLDDAKSNSNEDTGSDHAKIESLKKTDEELRRNLERMTKSVPNEESVTSKKEVPDEDKVPEKEKSDEKGGIPRSVDIIETNTADVERLGNSDTDSDKISFSLKFEDEEAMQNSMDTDSVDSEKLVSDSSEGEVLPTSTGTVSKSPGSKQNDFDTSKNESFASDAVGIGSDVAEIMGKTLDMVAGVISEMLEESGEIVEGSLGIDDTIDDKGILESESNEGNLMVNPDNDVATADEEEDDTDWSVVKSIGSHGTTESKKIGRAAEMLGSALFSSDMKSSAEGLASNSMSSDSSFSVPSSTPTDLGTVSSRIVAPSQATKWADELKKLKELGFDNEECCIGALERIRSDSKTNGINMDLVVNELLFLNS